MAAPIRHAAIARLVLMIQGAPPGAAGTQGFRILNDQVPEESSVMVQPHAQDREPAAPRDAPPSWPAVTKAVTAARDRYTGSLAQGFVTQLKAIDFTDQVMLFGAGLLVSLLPFLILLSAFASHRVGDDIALRLGLNQRASGIVAHLLTSAPATLNFATATSLLFVAAGSLAVAGSLQQIYEKVFHQDHLGLRGVYRLLIWIGVLCLVVAFESLVSKPVRDAVDGVGLVELVTFAIWTPFFWWTMHFLLAGRVPWRRLLPAAVFTGAFYVGLGVFSKFYFSSTITSDSHTYGTIGAILSILTWFIAIGAVIILGAAAGAVWQGRKEPADPGGSDR